MLRWFGCVCLAAAVASAARAQEFGSFADSGQTVLMTPVATNATVPIDNGFFTSRGGRLTVDVGFEYLRPAWRRDVLSLGVATPTAATNAIVGQTQNLTSAFSFVPRVGVDYQLPNDVNLGFGASGKILDLDGSLRRSLTVNGESANLKTDGNVKLVLINPIEFSKTFFLEESPLADWLREDSPLVDTFSVFTIGSRYVNIRQRYDGLLSTGKADQTTVRASQDYTGIGLTSSVSTLIPISTARNAGDPPPLSLFTAFRGSGTVGDNKRTTSMQMTPPPAKGNPTGVVDESRSQLVLSGEFEAGVVWGTSLGTNNAAGTFLWVRAGFTGQVWDNLGLLPPPTATRYSGGELLLYGFHIVAAIER